MKVQHKIISHINFMSIPIIAVMWMGKTIWTIASEVYNCFNSGIWKSTDLWMGSDIWKSN